MTNNLISFSNRFHLSELETNPNYLSISIWGMISIQKYAHISRIMRKEKIF